MSCAGLRRGSFSAQLSVWWTTSASAAFFGNPATDYTHDPFGTASSDTPISQVKIGDQVLATDPTTGTTNARTVTALIHHTGPHTMVQIHLTSGGTLTATDHHPFWNATTHHWTDATDLHPGDQLREPNGTLVTYVEAGPRRSSSTTPTAWWTHEAPPGCDSIRRSVTLSETMSRHFLGKGQDRHH
ncbi:MAG: Hint domain-containing protein [Mycobacteriales bacterium]